jgi:hypothetical protein
MKQRPAETHAVSVWKPGRDRMAFAVEADAGETEAFLRGQVDSDSLGSGDGVGHESFTTGFVDGRAIAVGDDDTKTSGAGGNRDCEACRPSADDENVCV